MAAGAGTRCVNNLEIPKLVEYLDYFNIMTYDMASSERSSHHTSLYKSDKNSSICGDEAIRLYNAAGVPFEKLIIGAAFYARVYENVDGINCPYDGGFPPGFGKGYAGTQERVKTAGGVQYDEQAEAPYIYDANTRTFITFDNERSIRAKRAYAEKNGLAGLMFWEYASDGAESQLVNAMADR